MKKFALMLTLSVCAFTGAMAQKPLKTFSSNINGNYTFDRDTCYVLNGCITVLNGTLTIQSGTTILGASATKGSLIIDTSGYIQALGTSSAPIIFTSDAAPGSRVPGQWGGIIIAGTATNNQTGGKFVVEGPCNPVWAGGNNDNDSSGVFQFVQINYAGVEVTPGGNNEINSLTLASVGRKTVIDHVQVNYANDDAFEWFGGTVNAKYLIAYNTKDDCFDTDFGFRGRIQFGFSIVTDTAIHDQSTSNGFESDNDATGSTNSPFTRPVFSNMTVLGINYCKSSTNAQFGRGAHIRRNSRQCTHNSIITGWRNDGLLVDGNLTVANTANATADQLNFQRNSLVSNGGTNFASAVTGGGATWASVGGCNTTMTTWLQGGPIPTCSEGNAAGDYSTAITGMSGTLCGDYCTTTPSFSNSTSNGTVSFTGDLATGFDVVTYRGAFGTTDWTTGWTNWCPNSQELDCASAPGLFEMLNQEAENALHMVPNPANGTTYAQFTAIQQGKVVITVLDKVTGQAVRTITADVQPGAQSIAVNISGLQSGIYSVRVQMNKLVLNSQLSVE
jgi:hypothetical protein